MGEKGDDGRMRTADGKMNQVEAARSKTHDEDCHRTRSERGSKDVPGPWTGTTGSGLRWVVLLVVMVVVFDDGRSPCRWRDREMDGWMTTVGKVVGGKRGGGGLPKGRAGWQGGQVPSSGLAWWGASSCW